MKGICCHFTVNAHTLAGEWGDRNINFLLLVILSSICWLSPKVGISVSLQGEARMMTSPQHNRVSQYLRCLPQGWLDQPWSDWLACLPLQTPGMRTSSESTPKSLARLQGAPPMIAHYGFGGSPSLVIPFPHSGPQSYNIEHLPHGVPRWTGWPPSPGSSPSLTPKGRFT